MIQDKAIVTMAD